MKQQQHHPRPHRPLRFEPHDWSKLLDSPEGGPGGQGGDGGPSTMLALLTTGVDPSDVRPGQPKDRPAGGSLLNPSLLRHLSPSPAAGMPSNSNSNSNHHHTPFHPRWSHMAHGNRRGADNDNNGDVLYMDDDDARTIHSPLTSTAFPSDGSGSSSLELKQPSHHHHQHRGRRYHQRQQQQQEQRERDDTSVITNIKDTLPWSSLELDGLNRELWK